MTRLQIALPFVASALTLVNIMTRTDDASDEAGKSRSIIKRLTPFGVFSVFALLILPIAQIVDTSQTSRASDERHAADTAMISKLRTDLALAKSTIDATYFQGKNVLARTDSSLQSQTQMGRTLFTNFQQANDDFRDLIEKSTSLLNPVLPMVARFEIRVPLDHPALREYASRILALRNAAGGPANLQAIAGVRRVELSSNALSGPTRMLPIDSIVESMVVDSTSPFYPRQELDGVGALLFRPEFYLEFYAAAGVTRDGPFQFRPGQVYQPVLALDARVHTADPEPSDFSYQRTIDIRFRSGYIAYALFFDVENHASETFDGGWNDLTETYLEVYGTLPDQLYEIDRVVLYTGPSFARRVAVGLKKSERTVRLAQSGAPMPGLAYSHRITRAEFKGRVLRK